MAKITLPEDLDYPVTFEVTNTGKRTRFRNGRNIVAAKGDDKPKPVTITVASRAEYLRLKGCKDLQLKPTKAKSGGDGLDKLNVDELDERLKAAELSTEGNKPDKVARLREHLAAQ